MPLRLFVLEALASMGYTRNQIEDSLEQAKYDDAFATYLLLGRKTTDVSRKPGRKRNRGRAGGVGWGWVGGDVIELR